MAIITQADIVYRKFSGYEDPRFPTGFWLGDGVVTGNNTGGTMVSQIDFALATGLFNSQYYSLDEIMIDLDEAASEQLNISITNFDSSVVITARRYTVPIQSNQETRSSIPLQQYAGLLPLFLGQQSTPNSGQSINLIRTNGDGDILTWRIGGYVWSARATSVPGGPQRPPSGLYRP